MQEIEVNATAFPPCPLTKNQGRTILATVIMALVLVGLPSRADASEVGTSEDFGLGLVLGYPANGLSINYFLSSSSSLQINPVLHVHNRYNKDNDHSALGGRVDLLFWMPRLESWSAADLHWYWGPGANVGIGLGDNTDIGVGAELPVGIGLRFHRAPIDLNLEAVPSLYIIHEFYLTVGVALNARYYF